MTQPISTSTISSSTDLGIEDLLKAAFARTKERFLPYILTYILSFFIFIGVFIALGLLGAINFVIWNIPNASVVAGILSFISGMVGLFALIYVGSWTGLAVIYSLVSPQKLGVLEVLKEVRPMVWSYVKVSVLIGLFMIGILPFGMLTVGILFILWATWGMFWVFVFIEKKESGIRSLFISKAIVKSKFWGIAFRSLMIYVLYLFIMYILGLAQSQKGAGGLGGVLVFVFSVLAGPFMTSYFYEIYKKIPHPKEIGSNSGWIGLSVIGWVINIALIIGLFSTAANVGENLMKNNPFQKNSLEKNFQMLDKQNNQQLLYN